MYLSSENMLSQYKKMGTIGFQNLIPARIKDEVEIQ